MTLAHDHARAASVATQASDTTVAINQHALAAGEFAKAASGTGSTEALRTLQLLEQHHRRLSELLSQPAENPAAGRPGAEVQATTEKPLSTSAAVAELRASKSDLGLRSSSPHRSPPALGPRRHPSRALSTSIASNLASARGIKGKYTRAPPLSPSVSTHQAPGSLETHRRHQLPSTIPEYATPSWIPPISPHKTESKSRSSRTLAAAETTSGTGASDEGFSKFYSAFENILYKLSAPLAFAGLPLTPDESTKKPEQEAPLARKARSRRGSQGSDPDLTTYISKAALRASGRDNQANDSFYVVPTAGGTVSYARILSFAEKEKRRVAASLHSENTDLFSNPEEENFVDARETPLAVSPKLSRGSSMKSKHMGEKELMNKVEELGIENKSLKDCIDKLAKRLQAFEMSAQQSSMALQESMRLVRDMSPAREREHKSPVLSPISQQRRENSDEGGPSDDTLQRRILDLEEHASVSGKEIERLNKENEKLKSVVARYRERWEKLKEGAKTRREGGAGTNGSPKKDPDPAAGRYVAG